MSRLVMAVLAACVLALPARAQERVDPGAAREAAEALIATANGDELFTPSVWEYGAVVRHTRSGLTCRFFSQSGDRVVVFGQGPDRADDVGCSIPAGGVLISLYATRADLLGGAANAAREAEAVIKETYPGVTPYAGAIADPPVVGMPPTIIRRFAAKYQDRDVFTRVAVTEVEGWVIKQRVTGPLEIAEGVDRLAGNNFAMLARDMGAPIRPVGATSPAAP